MAFGYDTVAGWLPATYDALLADFQTKYKSQAGDNVDVENGPIGDTARTVALMFKDAWDAQAAAYSSGFITAAPGTNGVAEGSSLELLLSPRIGPKLAATASTVTLPLFAAAGPDINVPAGSAVVLESESVTWTLDAPVLIPGGGSIDGEFTYSLTGPKTAQPGSSWTIQTPVAGWVSVGPNVAAAVVGRNLETDAEYRARWLAAVLDNIVAAVGKVEGVTLVSLIEWPYGVPDGYWGQTHWVELIVVGGTDAAVAAAIAGPARALGVSTQGNTSVGVADPDYVGGSLTIKFSRAVEVTTYAEITITPGEGYPADVSAVAVAARAAAVKAAVSAHVASLGPGVNTSGFKVAAAIAANAGIPGIDSIVAKIDTIDPPVNTGTLVADVREQFVIALADIDVIGA